MWSDNFTTCWQNAHSLQGTDSAGAARFWCIEFLDFFSFPSTILYLYNYRFWWMYKVLHLAVYPVFHNRWLDFWSNKVPHTAANTDEPLEDHVSSQGASWGDFFDTLHTNFKQQRGVIQYGSACILYALARKGSMTRVWSEHQSSQSPSFINLFTGAAIIWFWEGRQLLLCHMP